MTPERRTEFIRFIKYCTVGGMNTLVTLAVIFVCKSLLGWNPYISNVLGYICGLINSFLWNRTWVFRSGGNYRGEALKFACGFGLCYGIQLLVVWGLSTTLLAHVEILISSYTLSGYGIATLIANVVYTVTNFLYNRLITFR